MTKYSINSASILSHRWIDNKLVVDFQYSTWVSTVDGNGNTNGSRNIKTSGIAILDPDSGHWQVMPYPAQSADSKYQFWQHNYYSTTLFKGEIYLSYEGKFWMCDKANQWRALDISDGNNYQLFAVNGHLYATDSAIIFEIVDGGKSTKLLASARRRPAKSTLDSLEFGVAPVLFLGPNNSLRTSVAGQLFSWTGSDWRLDGKLPNVRRAEVLTEGVLFCGAGSDYQMTEAYVPTSSTAPEVLFHRSSSTPMMYASPVLQRQIAAETQSVWETSEDIAAVPQATRGPDVYMLLDHSTVQNVVSNHVIVERKISPEGGCHAKLLHFVRGQSQPKPQYLMFEAKDACPPVQGGRRTFAPGLENGDWILFTSKWFLLGTESSIGVVAGGNHMACPPGVWICPASKID